MADHFDPYLAYAKSRGINIIKGGLDKVDFKPDIIILSHVVEHWNNFGEEIKKLINQRSSPIIINYQMNAGPLPIGHWIFSEECGGRIIGEACHIFDLFSYFIDAPATEVNTTALGGKRDISGEEEINRVAPLVKEIRARSGGMISVDTSKSAVADAAIKAGANMVNDVWALKKDPEMVEVVASAKVYVVLMHNDSNPSYSDVVYDTIESLKKSVDKAVRDGIPEDLIIIDPGIGFGKDMRQNLTILRRLEEYKSIGRPILVGTSRKSTIGNILQVPVHERTYGTAASIAIAIAKGTNIVRVHDVGEMAQVCKMSDAIIREGAQ